LSQYLSTRPQCRHRRALPLLTVESEYNLGTPHRAPARICRAGCERRGVWGPCRGPHVGQGACCIRPACGSAAKATLTDGITAGVAETTESATETTVGEADAIDAEGAGIVARANRVGRGARARAPKDAFVRAGPGRFATVGAGTDSSSKGADDTSTVAGGAVTVPRERASSSRWAAGMTLAATKTTIAARASPFANPNAARRVWT
jgi:hypothetical protein